MAGKRELEIKKTGFSSKAFILKQIKWMTGTRLAFADINILKIEKV